MLSFFNYYYRASSWTGDDALGPMKPLLEIKYPITRGVVSNWDDMEMLLHHAFYTHLCVAPEEHPLFISEAAYNPKTNKEKLVQITFETFNCPALFVEHPGVLAMYSHGRVTGVSVESGAEVTSVTPLYEGYPVPKATFRSDQGGR